MRQIPLFFALIAISGLTACDSSLDKLARTCNDLKAISLMTDDCDKMAQKLAPAASQLNKFIDGFTPDEQLPLYQDTLKGCMEAYTEIYAGPCGNNSKVISIIDKAAY